MMTGILAATVCVALTGLFIGVFLGIAGKKFAIEVDERETAVLGVLPGNNCGGCGYAGCSGLAAAIVKGEAPVNGCPVGGSPVADKVAKIMGSSAGVSVKKAAFVKCAGDCEKAGRHYEYSGLTSCTMQGFVPAGGEKKCAYGCLGGGDCVNACQFGAINIENGIAVVDEELCTACGMCVKACPRHLIELVPTESRIRVACSSKDKGPVAMKGCEVACIGCQMCVKKCESDAIHVTDFLAKVDYDKCIQCGECAKACPKHAIIS